MASPTLTRADVEPVSREEFDALVERIAALEAARPPASAEDVLMPQLLAAIFAEWNSDPFLSEHVREDVNLRFITKGRSVKSIGRLLARNAGRTFDGLMLVAEPRTDRRCRWSVQRV